jgi:hypothetical protein
MKITAKANKQLEECERRITALELKLAESSGRNAELQSEKENTELKLISSLRQNVSLQLELQSLKSVIAMKDEEAKSKVNLEESLEEMKHINVNFTAENEDLKFEIEDLRKIGFFSVGADNKEEEEETAGHRQMSSENENPKRDTELLGSAHKDSSVDELSDQIRKVQQENDFLEFEGCRILEGFGQVSVETLVQELECERRRNVDLEQELSTQREFERLFGEERLRRKELAKLLMRLVKMFSNESEELSEKTSAALDSVFRRIDAMHNRIRKENLQRK